MVAAVALVVAFNKVEAMRAPFLAFGCRVGFGKACVKAGWIYVHHRKDDATRLLQHGCDASRTPKAASCWSTSSPPACWAKPTSRAPEAVPGRRHYALACSMLADETINGQFGDHERQKRAERFFARACALGRTQDCAAIATVPARIGEMNKLNEITEACARTTRRPARR